MKFDEIFHDVLALRDKLVFDNGPDYKPNIAIYMQIDCWYECMSEVDGGVTRAAMEAYQSNSLAGHPIYQVVSRGPMEARHPFVQIVALNPK